MSPARGRVWRDLTAAALLGLTVGCAKPLVDWTAPPRTETPDAVGAPQIAGLVRPPTGLGLTDTIPPAWMGAVCAGSLRWARGFNRDAYAAWWSPRSNRSAVLVVARVLGGSPATWMPPVGADDSDRGTRGCDRSPPSIVVDSATGWPHLAYYLDGAKGSGVYAVHSMLQGRMFDPVVPIVMGDHPVAATVAVQGQTVVVAFEDPNGDLPSVGVAVSGMGGHYFEPARIRASSEGVAASLPRVAVQGDDVTVAWEETPREGSDGGSPQLMARSGVLHIPAQHVASLPPAP